MTWKTLKRASEVRTGCGETDYCRWCILNGRRFGQPAGNRSSEKKYNASIYVDEAHGLGVFGKQGRGVCDHFGVTEDIDLIMGTFSKSLASIGGFIAGDKEVINWLRHNARSYIFQASSTPAATAAAREALHIIKSEPERIQRLWDITNYALKSFRDAGLRLVKQSRPLYLCMCVIQKRPLS